MSLMIGWMIISYLPMVLAGVNFTRPKRGDAFEVGNVIAMWEEDGRWPRIDDFSTYTLQLMVGGNEVSTSKPVTALETQGIFENGNYVSGTIQPDLAGPTRNGYYLMMRAIPRVDSRASVTYYSPRFNIPDMNGTTPAIYEEAAEAVEGNNGPAPVFYPTSAFESMLSAKTAKSSRSVSTTKELVITRTGPSYTTVITPTSTVGIESVEIRKPSLSTNTKAGIGAGAVCGALLVLYVSIECWRRRNRSVKGKWTSAELPHDKAELSASEPDPVRKSMLELHEADGQAKPVEADDKNTRAELESDWTGWEAPALLEVELSRPQRVLR